MEITTYTGPIVSGKGRKPSAESVALRAAILESAESGTTRELRGLSDDDKRKFPQRMRDMAAKAGLSLSVGSSPEGNLVFKASKREDEPAAEAAAEPAAEAAPAKPRRTSRK